MVGAFTLTGELNQSAFEQAWQAVLQRHEVLRTRFEMQGENVRLQVQEQVESVVRFLPFSTVAESEPDKNLHLEALIQRELNHVFDLSVAPLLRVLMLPLNAASSQWAMVVNMHHIITDGWSVALMIKEFCYFYQVFSAQSQTQSLTSSATLPALPALPV